MSRRCGCSRMTRSTGAAALGACAGYHYRFATRAEHRATGDRWVRTLEGEVIGPATLR